MHQFIFRYHKAIILCAVLLSALSIFFAFRLKLDLSLFSLLPADSPEVQRFFQVTENIGFQSLLITLVEVNANPEPDKINNFIDALAHRYQQSNMIEAVDYKSDNEALFNMFHTVLQYVPQLLKQEDLNKLARRLSHEQIQQKVIENKHMLMTPFGITGKEMIFQDPLGIGELLYSSLTIPGMNISQNNPNEYYRTEDHRTYFLFLKPVKPPQDIAFSKMLMQELKRMERLALSENAEELGALGNQIMFRHTGGHPIAVTDEAITKFDIKVTLLTSFVGVLLLFFLTFRTLKILLLVSVPLLLSLLWTIGFAGLVFQRLNILTCIFSCVLIGLGIDFAIHIINRFYDPDYGSLKTIQRLEITFKEAGTGILVGGVTTAAAFFSLGISDFKGFKELGYMTGCGILCCLLAMMFLLPSLLVMSALHKNKQQRIIVSGFGLKRLLETMAKYSGSLLILFLMIISVLIYAGTSIRFDDNLKNFRPKDYAVLNLQNKVTHWLGGSMGVVLLTVTDASEKNVLTLNADIFQALQELKKEGDISGISSISQLIPSPRDQQRSMDYVKANKETFNIRRIRKSFDIAMASYGFRQSDQYDFYFKQLAKAFSSENILLPSDVDSPKLNRFLNRFYFQQDKQFTAVTYINPPMDLWSYDETIRFKEMIVRKLAEKGIDESSFHLTGANLLTGELKQLIMQNFKASLGLAVGSILLILLIYFRNLKNLLLSIMPLGIGMAALSGVMVVLGLDFNFLNIMVLPMIIGIGIDDGVHFTNTFRQSDSHGLQKGLFQTSRAVVLTSLTTMVGFGSIALSHYPGLKSMGYVAVIGIVTCLLSSIIVLPAVFSLIKADHE